MQPYFDIATWYGFANRMFQTNQGPSFPAHQFLLTGTSAPDEVGDSNDGTCDHSGAPCYQWFAATNGYTKNNQNTGSVGCTADSGTYVKGIDTTGNEYGSWYVPSHGYNQTPGYPCFEHPSLTDQLDSQKLTWTYYAPTASSIWTAPNSIWHMCDPQPDPVTGRLECVGTDWTQHVVLNPKQILTDLGAGSPAQCNLADVSWVIPKGQYSDHALLNNGTGPAWVASIVDTLGDDPGGCGYWPHTVVLITWDDWGGWYDHKAPYSANGYINGHGNGVQFVYGFRVPLLVVSAYSPSPGNPGYVSTNYDHDFGSILRFVEYIFGLNPIDGNSYPYADVFAPDVQENLPYALADFFNFNQSPRQFHHISAPYDAAYFLSDNSPPLDPDNDANEDNE